MGRKMGKYLNIVLKDRLWNCIMGLSKNKEVFPIDFKKEIQEKIDELVEKVKSDKNIAAKFQSDPIATVEELLGIDLPNDQIEKVVDMIKAKINVDKISGALGGIGKLFGK